MSKEKITGVILAGGKSSRMGSDKGMLEVMGKKMITRILETLRPLVQEVIVISNGDNYNNLGCLVLNDVIKDRGPMGGIYTALNQSKTEKIMVVSCDMPFVSTEVLTKIVCNSFTGDVVVPEHSGGRLEPLCAVYSKSCMGQFGEMLNGTDWKLLHSFNYFKVHKIYFSDHELPLHYFLNINTPLEYHAIKNFSYEYSN